MADKTNSSPLAWKSPRLELEEAFKKGDFSTLISYADENAMLLRTLFLSENFKELRDNLRFGSCIFSYFENSIKADSQMTALFKLGELYGYIGLLDSISYEDDQNELAKARFELALSQLPNHKAHFANALIAISEKVGIQKQDLLTKVSMPSEEFQEMMSILVNDGFVCDYGDILGYSLSDTGLRLAMLLKKENK